MPNDPLPFAPGGLSRYPAAEVDRITCAEPDAIQIYALGGSVAQGLSASGQATSWLAVFEKRLREGMLGALVEGCVRIGAGSEFTCNEMPRDAIFNCILML